MRTGMKVKHIYDFEAQILKMFTSFKGFGSALNILSQKSKSGYLIWT